LENAAKLLNRRALEKGKNTDGKKNRIKETKQANTKVNHLLLFHLTGEPG